MEAYRRPPWAGDISGLRSLHRCLDTNASEEGRARDLGDRGVIAQEMLETDLAFAVKGGGTEEIEIRDDEGNVTKEIVEVPHCVNYNVLLATALQAIKDLSSKVNTLEARLDSAGLL